MDLRRISERDRLEEDVRMMTRDSPEHARSYSLSLFSDPEMLQRFSQQNAQLFSSSQLTPSAFHPPGQTFPAFSLVSLQAHQPLPLHPQTSLVESNKRKSSAKNTESSKKTREKPSGHSLTRPPEDNSGTGRARISCPVCGDTAVPHFHYGGMCCYSCKAFFRRVVNTYKVTKYTCRSGTGDCDVSLANRRSCQACRYRKCIAAGMKPGLVLSDDQCNKRFGMKKDEPNPETPAASKKEETEASGETLIHRAIENEFSVLIDSEKSYEEQVNIGRPLFVSLLSSGTVANLGERSGRVQGVTETLAVMISFQTERQISNARKFLPLAPVLLQDGRLDTGHILNTLVQQIVLVIKQNKQFRSLSSEDQQELCQANVMVAIFLSCLNLYSSKTAAVTWPGPPPVEVSLQTSLAKVEVDLKEELVRLSKLFESFSKLDLPRSAVNLLILISMFNPEFCKLEDGEAVRDTRLRYTLLLYEVLCHKVGVRRACTLASNLHNKIQNLDRICQILGQKFVSVS